MGLRIRKSSARKVAHPIRRLVYGIFMVFLVLGVLILVGGVLYTWANGGYSEETETTYTKLDKPIKTTPTPNKPGVEVTVAIQSLTSPVMPGQDVSLKIKTGTDARCVVDVTYDKTVATGGDLVQKPADTFGFVNWNWTVPETAPEGTWPVKITCTSSSKRSTGTTIQGDLVVTKDTSKLPAATERSTPAN